MISTARRITTEQLKLAEQYANGHRDGRLEASDEIESWRLDLIAMACLVTFASGLFWRDLFTFFVG